MSDHVGYAIVIERAPDGIFGAWAPELLGCVALGETVEECEREMRSAILLHLAGMREDGDPIPVPSAVASTVIDVDAA